MEVRTEARATRALVVDEHALFGQAIAAMLEREGYEIVDVVGTGHDALEAARRSHPDLVLLGLDLPDRSGVEIGKAILDESPSTKLLAVSATSNADSVRRAVRAGFHGYVTTGSGIAHLVNSLNVVLEGRTVLPDGLGGQGVVVAPGTVQAHRLAAQLTPRERETLRLLAEGVTTREMARRLHISPNTVRSHVQGLMTKLQVHSRLEAVAFASRYGLASRAPIGAR